MQIDATLAAVVTGGASGLGRATAEALAAAGARVTIFDINDDLGREVANAIGGQFVHVDIMSEQSVLVGFAAARAFSETALKPSPGGSMKPFCDPATVTSTFHSSCR